MANIETVFTQAETEAMMDDAVRNPTSNEADAEVHITLTFRGTTMNPNTLYNAIQGLGTVVRADKVPGRGNYSFVVSAS